MVLKLTTQVLRPINEEPDDYITTLINDFFAAYGHLAFFNFLFHKTPFADSEGMQTFFLTAEATE